MRKFAVALTLVAMTGSVPALAQQTMAPHAEASTVGALIERAGLNSEWVLRAVDSMPQSVREIDAHGLSQRLGEYVPAQLQGVPGLGNSDEDAQMRAMVITMGAMSGYMLAAMPISFSGVIWAVAGGYAASYIYEHSR